MTKLMNLLEFAAELRAVDHDLEAMIPKIIERAAVKVEKRVRAMVGKEHDEWPALAPSTLADKQAKGYRTPAPLLREGTFRDSIEHVVDARGHEAAVGTNDVRGPWFEFGTSKMPPRPVLVPAAIASEDKIRRMVGTAATAALSGHGRHASDISELLRLPREAGNELRDIAEDILHDSADDGRDR
jgi:hypothetical protein